jgi:membrane protein DedA with SNARE-associated domain
MILADALGTLWWSALCVVVGFALGWFVKSKYGKHFTL